MVHRHRARGDAPPVPGYFLGRHRLGYLRWRPRHVHVGILFLKPGIAWIMASAYVYCICACNLRSGEIVELCALVGLRRNLPRHMMGGVLPAHGGIDGHLRGGVRVAPLPVAGGIGRGARHRPWSAGSSPSSSLPYVGLDLANLFFFSPRTFKVRGHSHDHEHRF